MTTAELFDRHAAEYDAALRQGIRLSGEAREYFSRGRVGYLVAQMRRLGAHGGVRRILDFGCGPGATSAELLEVFPCTEVVGVDVSGEMVARARRERQHPALCFETLDEGRSWHRGSLIGFDLVYVANVFHHVEASGRLPLLRRLHGSLRPGGHLAFFENNPWNPGARAVMARIPFDRDAVPLSVLEARRWMREAGFHVVRTGSLFYFPRILARLRRWEWALERWPLGAQYAVIARARA